MFMISGIILKILSIILLALVGIVLILGIGTLFKGGETSKKYSNKLMQLKGFATVYCNTCFGWFCLLFQKLII